MKKIILFFILLLISGKTYSQPDTVKIGVFINSISGFKIDEGTFDIDFWIWFNYTNDSLAPLETTEIINAKEYNYSLQLYEKKGNINWATQKCKATIRKNWDVRNFPFDSQKFRIQLEESALDYSDLVYITDSANSKIDANFNLDEWEINSLKVYPVKAEYNTTYGDPDLVGTSSYPRMNLEMVFEREHSITIFMKLVTGVYVSFFISILVLMINPVDLDPRFGLCVGGLFASIGNKYIIESIVPATVYNTLLDSIHNYTFIFILIIIILSIISLNLAENKKENISKIIDRTGFYSLTLLYIIINLILITSSVN